LARIAARQFGVLSVRQLRAAGFDKHAVRSRVRAGRLHPVHREVYAVGHPGISREGRWLAAVLASGDGAVLSHAAAAAHWGLLRPMTGPVDVSVPTQAGRRGRAGVRLHRRRALARGEVTRHGGIPVTTPARTIADLRGVLAPRLVRRAQRQAETLGLPLGLDVPSDRTRSDLERDFLRLCRRFVVPVPEVNVRVGRWTVDFLWRARRLVVEADSYLYHRGAVAFRQDRARDLDLRERGYEVRRFSERQIDEQPERVAADIAGALGVVGRPAAP